MFLVIGQVLTMFYRLNDVNSMSMFICAKLDELKIYVFTATCCNTKCYAGFRNSGSDLIINALV